MEIFRVNNAAAPVVTADPSGYGEGYSLLVSCVDGAGCDASVIPGEVIVTVSGLAVGDTVTATATDATNGTSEFA